MSNEEKDHVCGDCSWSDIIEAFTAGLEFRTKHPTATANEMINAAIKYADDHTED
jgi:hypothetical protein